MQQRVAISRHPSLTVTLLAHWRGRWDHEPPERAGVLRGCGKGAQGCNCWCHLHTAAAWQDKKLLQDCHRLSKQSPALQLFQSDPSHAHQAHMQGGSVPAVGGAPQMTGHSRPSGSPGGAPGWLTAKWPLSIPDPCCVLQRLH